MLHIFKSESNGEYYGHFAARNGKITWRTSETYKQKRSVLKAYYSLYDDFRKMMGLPKRIETPKISFIDHSKSK